MSRVNKTEITVFFLNTRLFMISVKLYMISAVRNIFIKADVTVDSVVLHLVLAVRALKGIK